MRDPYGDPTPEMLELLAKRGVPVPEGARKIDVSILIDSLPPTKDQLRFAVELGVSAAGKTGRELSKDLDEELTRLGIAALKGNSALRVGKFITYKGEVVKILKINRSMRRAPTLSIRPVTGGRAKAVAAGLLANVEEVDPATAILDLDTTSQE